MARRMGYDMKGGVLLKRKRGIRQDEMALAEMLNMTGSE
jgi:hypothetical protein